MSKNGIIGLSAGAIIVLGGLSFYTNNAFSEQVKHAIDMSNNTIAKVALESQQTDLLSGTSQYKVTINANQLMQQSMATPPPAVDNIELYVNHSYTSYPLYVKSELTLDFTKGAGKELMEKFDSDQIAHLLTINTNVLSQSQTANLHIEPTELKDKSGDAFVSSAFDLSADSDLAFSKIDLALAFNKFVLNVHNKGTVTMEGLTSTGVIENVEGIYLGKSSVLNLASLSYVNEAVQEELSVGKIEVVSNYSDLTKEALDGYTLMTMDAAKFKNTLMEYNIDKTAIEINFNNLDRDGVLSVSKAQRESTSPMAMLDGAKSILSRGFNAEVKQLNTRINDVAFDSKGQLDFPAYQGELNQNELMMHVMSAFTMNYSANLSNNYAEVFPQYAPMIDGMAAQGFVAKDEAGNVSTVIEMKDSQVLANGKRIR